MRNNQPPTVNSNDINTIAASLNGSSHPLRAELASQASTMQHLLQMLETEKCPDKTQEILIFLQNLSQSFSNAVERYNKPAIALTQAANMSVVSFEDVFEKVINQITNLIFETNTVIEADFSQRRYVTTTHGHLESSMLNSLSNAIRNCQPGEAPQISIRSFAGNGSTLLVISCNDHNEAGTDPENPDARGIGASNNQEVSLEEKRSSPGTTIKIRFNDQP